MQTRGHVTPTGKVLLWFLMSAVLLYGQSVAPVQAQLGSNLIGKLEGPEVVSDAAQMPKRFQEAPAMTALVQQGKLPPVQERVSQEPMVIKPVHEIGRHGGTWRRGFSGPADFWNGFRCCGHDKILFWDYTAYASLRLRPQRPGRLEHCAAVGAVVPLQRQ